ncbi:hypothetical protein [Streptomyces morookaense]|uniref:Uncharacterized protein n=1 Tax=Streptomyces morookaense TaxID=1970 RepID=A0A7Y7AZD4_STRMO|nr:hypothetical protein [Streptomyces morookaense]NVK76176.1 hypothetical protein [Streptomyces morookaense]
MMHAIRMHITRRLDGRVRRLWAWAGSVALIAAAVVAGPAAVPARAAQGDLACAAQFTMAMSPALKPNGSASVNVTASLSSCTSANGNYARLQSATATASGTATADGAGKGPCGVLFTAQGTGTITWSDKSTSTIQFTVNTDPTNGTVTFHCVITGGTLSNDGDTVVPVISGAQCTSGGLQSMSAHMAVDFA